jgi:hypothetical protein
MFRHTKFRTASFVAVLLMVIYVLFAASDPSLTAAQFCCGPTALFIVAGLLLGVHEARK